MSDWLGSRHVKSDVTRVMYPNVFASLGSAQVHIPLVLLKISINSSSDKWNSLWMIPALDPIIWTFNNNLYSSLDWWIWPVTLKHWDVKDVQTLWHSISQNARQRIWEMSLLSRTHLTMLNSNLSELSIGPDLFSLIKKKKISPINLYSLSLIEAVNI